MAETRQAGRRQTGARGKGVTQRRENGSAIRLQVLDDIYSEKPLMCRRNQSAVYTDIGIKLIHVAMLLFLLRNVSEAAFALQNGGLQSV